jgi:hypothetical protein
MNDLRLKLYQAGWYGDLARLTDAEILEEAGRLLEIGQLRIDVETLKETGGGAIAPAQAVAAPVPPPPRQTTPKEEEVAEPDPDTLPPNVDAATQAATLQAAAAQGAPFCPT